MIDTKRLLPQLGYWSFHASLCAAPSFIIAYQNNFNKADSVAGMLTAILIFIIGYTLVTSTYSYGRNREKLFGKAVRTGTNIRLAISILSLLVIIFSQSYVIHFHNLPESYQFLPDFWCGCAALFAILWLFKSGGIDQNDIDADFTTGFLATLLEGILLSLVLFTIIFVAYTIINIRTRNKHYRELYQPERKEIERESS